MEYAYSGSAHCRDHIRTVSSWGALGSPWGVPTASIWFLRKGKVVTGTPRCFPGAPGADSIVFGRNWSEIAVTEPDIPGRVPDPLSWSSHPV